MIQIKVVKAMRELITLDTRKVEILKALHIFVSLLKANTQSIPEGCRRVPGRWEGPDA